MALVASDFGYFDEYANYLQKRPVQFEIETEQLSRN